LLKPSRPLILGVDPGLNGALAWYNFETKSLVDVADMPLSKVPHKKNPKQEVNDHALNFIVDLRARETAFAVVEEVGARPKDGRTSAFRFEESYRAVKTVLNLNEIPVYFVLPSVWKILMGLSSNKKESIDLAAAKFKGSREKYFSLKKHDGRAEAALLALFGERFLAAHDSGFLKGITEEAQK